MTVSLAPSGCAKGTKRQLQTLTQYDTESPPLAGTTNPHLGASIRHLLSTPILVVSTPPHQAPEFYFSPQASETH